MRDSDGCLWWILGTIGWFLLWGFCISIGDEYKISPFTVLFLLVIATVIVAVLVIFIYTSSHNKIYNKQFSCRKNGKNNTNFFHQSEIYNKLTNINNKK